MNKDKKFFDDPVEIADRLDLIADEMGLPEYLYPIDKETGERSEILVSQSTIRRALNKKPGELGYLCHEEDGSIHVNSSDSLINPEWGLRGDEQMAERARMLTGKKNYSNRQIRRDQERGLAYEWFFGTKMSQVSSFDYFFEHMKPRRKRKKTLDVSSRS